MSSFCLNWRFFQIFAKKMMIFQISAKLLWFFGSKNDDFSNFSQKIIFKFFYKKYVGMIFQNLCQNWWFLGAKMMNFQILVKIDGFSKLPMPHFHIYHIWYGLTKVLWYCETETSIEYHKSVARLFVILEGLTMTHYWA